MLLLKYQCTMVMDLGEVDPSRILVYTRLSNWVQFLITGFYKEKFIWT